MERAQALREARRLDALKKQIKKNATKWVMKVLNITAGATIIFAVVSFVLMNAQLVLGNMLGGYLGPFWKDLELDKYEMIFLGFMWFLFIIGVVIVIGILTVLSDPAGFIIELLTDAIKTFFGNVWDALVNLGK